MPDDADGPRERNPYAVPDREPERPAARGPGPGPAARPDPRVLARVRRVVLLGVLACICAITLPPLGLALGVLTAVLALRLRRDEAVRRLGPAGTLVPLVGAGFAVVTGSLLSVFMLWLAPELGELRQCLAGANTRAAEQRCQQEFRDGLGQRLGAG